MRINEKIINDFKNYIVDETEFERLAEVAFKEQYGKSFIKVANYFADILVESMLIECAEKIRFSRISRGYGYLSYCKKNDKNYREIPENKQFLRQNETTFARGFNRFIKTFGFNNNKKLKHQLRTYFKNYKFRSLNIINDYSVLYFTFKIYENLFENNEIDQEACAKQCARTAFKRLHNPRKKKSVTVTWNSLASFVRKFDFPDWQVMLISIFWDFIEDVYYADEIDEITQFSFFTRFYMPILLINIYSNMLINDRPLIPSVDTKTVLRRTSNRIQYGATRKTIPLEELRQIKELQHLFTLLENHTHELRNPSKKYVDMSNRIYEIANSLLNSQNDFTLEIFYKVMNDYKELYYFDGDKCISAYNMFSNGLSKSSLKEFLKLINIYKPDNIYLQLILSMSKSLLKDTSPKINELYENVIGSAEKYVNELCLDEDISNEKALLSLLNPVNLNAFGVPIIDAISVYEKKRNYLTVLAHYLF